MRDGVCGYNAGDAMIVLSASVIAVVWINN
jgi:hypothetical protein